MRLISRSIALLGILNALVSCGGGGGGDSSNKCFDYAEYACNRIADCLDVHNEDAVNQCFASAVEALANRGATESSCEQAQDTVDDLSCEQLIALLNNSRTASLDDIPLMLRDDTYSALSRLAY